MYRPLILLALASCSSPSTTATEQPVQAPVPAQWCVNEVATLEFQSDAMFYQWDRLSQALVEIERIADEQGYDDIKVVVAEVTQ